ncbi:MAG: cytochrome c biogenesis protein CcsA [Planctomycetota bacterium]
MTPLAPLDRRPARSLAAVALVGAALVLPLLVALAAPVRPVSAEPDAPREAGSEARATVLPTWSDDLLDLVRRLPVQEGGRVKPLSTWARFTLLRLNGKASYKPESGTSAAAEARSALAWALDCLYFPELAKEQRIFLVEEGQVLETLRLEIPDRKKRDRYSYAELAPARETLDRKATEFAKELRDKERRDGKVRHGDFTPAQWELQRLDANVTVYERMLATLDFARTTIDATPLAGHLEGLADPARAAPVEVLRRLPAVWNRLRDTATPGADGAPTFTDEGRALLEAISTVRTRLQGVVTERDALALFPPGPHALASDTWFGPQEAFLRAEDGGRHDPVLLGAQTDDPQVVKERIADFDQQMDWLAGWGSTLAVRSDPHAIASRIQPVTEGVEAAATRRGEYRKVALEIAYYRLDPLFFGLLAYIFGFVLLAVTWLLPRAKWVYIAALVALGVGLVFHITGITMRCMIRGRPPVSTLYETILFIGGCIVITCLAMERMNRQRIAVALAAVLGAASLWMAYRYELFRAEDTMPELQAVLDTNFWLSTHVTTVTLGYGAGLLAAALGHIYLLGRIFGFKSGNEGWYRTLTRMTYGVLAFGLLFSVVGTILGGVWANDSWGRFWGWDPKENGALMICLWEVAILHARMGGYLKSHGLALAAVATGPIVAFSWWGVNLLEIGLHSYGFTTGVGARLRVYYVLEAAVLLAGIAWWLMSRRAPRPTTGDQSAA